VAELEVGKEISMKPRDFFVNAKEIITKTESSDPIGVDYCIQDLEELIEAWRSEWDDKPRNAFDRQT